MNNIIIRETCGEIRAIARGALSGRWAAIVLGFFVYYIMTVTIPSLLTELMPFASYTYYAEALGKSVQVSYVYNLYEFALSGAFIAGMSSFLLLFFRKKDGNPAHIFNGFEFFPKAFCLFVVQGFFIFMWTLLFVIPGIIASIRYSQAYFILADDPKKGVMQCIRESKLLMTGNKGKYFSLMLSYIGWLFLSILPAVILIQLLPANGILGLALELVYSIPYFAAMGYVYLGRTVFYDLAAGRLVAKTSAFSSQQTQNAEDDNYYF